MNCPECGQPLTWYGMHYGEHSTAFHNGLRERKLRALAKLIRKEIDFRWWAWGLTITGHVGVAMRSGVYPNMVCRTDVLADVWDTSNQDRILGLLRIGATEWAKDRYGVDVNPATWKQRVYDGRTP